MKGSVAERIAVTLICFGYMTLGSVLSVMAGIRRVEYTNAIVAEVLMFELVFGLAAAVVLHRRGWKRDDFGFAPTLRSTAGAFALFVVVLFAYQGAYAVLATTGLLTGWSDADVIFNAAAPLMLLFLVVNSVFEEVFVVGYLVEATQSSGLAYAVSISTAVRLLYHTYQGPVALASIVPIGLIFGAVYARYRNLWPLIVAHTLINVYGWMVK